MRSCGDCQLCCRLVPVKDIEKPAGVRCQHQRHGKGCAVYAKRPTSCVLWSCRWLADEKAELPRPDRCHYVVDIVPDFVTRVTVAGDEQIMVAQVWIDPKYPDAWKCKSLFAFLLSNRCAGLIRFDARDAIVLLPPFITGGDWEAQRGKCETEHTGHQVNDFIRGQRGDSKSTAF